MCRPRINRSILKRVEAMTKQGVPQNEIADALGMHRNSVYRYQRRLGLQACQGITPEEERVILDLLKAGHGTSWIGRTLHCGEHRPRLVAKKYKIRRIYSPRSLGIHFHPTAAQVIRITDLALGHEHSAKAIATIVGVPYRTTVRICHQVLDCDRFIGGGTRVGLDSYLPTKWRSTLHRPRGEETMTPEWFVHLFFRFARRPGVMTSDSDILFYANILLKARSECFGVPNHPQEYFGQLCQLVEQQLNFAATAAPIVN